MTVAELMAILATKPQTARVVVCGLDECDYNDVGKVVEQPIKVGQPHEGYHGQHESPMEGVEPDEIAILIDL